MLDLARIQRIQLTPRPFFQQLMARAVLAPNYDLPPRVRIELENGHLVPDEPVIFAMNHTDRFNYWPFQYKWWRTRDRFTATWVKGKYYETKIVGTFMEVMNNIPTVSRGYLITKDFLSTLARRPTDEEYSTLRALIDAEARGEPEEPPTGLPRPLLEQPRDMLGRHFDPKSESYAHAIDQLFRAMMRRFVDLNRQASAIGLDLLIFPQGTRSKRLSRGHVGLAQMALDLERPVVPVGCNGSDRVYPGSSPIGRPGRIVYRFGEPIRPRDVPGASPGVPFEPFTAEAERDHRVAFQTFVDEVMQRIDGLVDPEYRFGEVLESDGVRGSERFV